MHISSVSPRLVVGHTVIGSESVSLVHDSGLVTYLQGTAQTVEQDGKEEDGASAVHGFGSFSEVKVHTAEDQ